MRRKGDVGKLPRPSDQSNAYFVGSSRKDLRALPKKVRIVFAYAILTAQRGFKHPNAKPLKGFGGAGVLEVVEDHDSDTYRAVYTVRFSDAVYVLHAFKKKSNVGRKTPPRDIELVTRRLREAEEHYQENFASEKR